MPAFRLHSFLDRLFSGKRVERSIAPSDPAWLRGIGRQALSKPGESLQSVPAGFDRITARCGKQKEGAPPPRG